MRSAPRPRTTMHPYSELIAVVQESASDLVEHQMMRDRHRFFYEKQKLALLIVLILSLWIMFFLLWGRLDELSQRGRASRRTSNGPPPGQPRPNFTLLRHMSISDLVPTLQPMVEDLNQQLRFICFFILTGSIIVRTGSGSTSINQLLRPIVTNIMICALLATLPFWFNAIRDEFWNIAVAIRKEFTGSVDGTGAALMQLIEPPDTGINWLDVGNSLMKAVQYAIGWLIVWTGGMIQFPMIIIQYVMECMCYLFLPIALSLFAFDSTKGLAIRYVQQTLAILAWPIGFAVVDLVGYALLTSVTSAVSAGAIAVGVATKFTPATMVIGGIVAVWLILGSLVTPIVMQMLFCSGTPMSSAMGQAIQMGLGVGYNHYPQVVIQGKIECFHFFQVMLI